MTETSTRPRRIVTGLVAGAAVAATLATGVPAASASTTSTAWFTIAGANGKQTGLVHGAINGGGKDISPDDAQYDTLRLGGGSIRLNHPDKASHFKVVRQNRRTCYFKFRITGRYTLDHGTGRFAGVTGKGKYRAIGQAIAKRTSTGACDENAEPRVSVFVVHGHGPVTLP